MATGSGGCLDAALRYLRAGLSVIPTDATKRPLLSTWREFQERQPTEEEVRAWWSRWPEANVAIICGPVSGGLAVLDVDDAALAERLAADAALLAQTAAVRTPGGGLHLYVRETDVPSRSGPLVPGEADLKAAGGYVLAPPSRTAKGEYRALSGGQPLRVPNARDWALALLQEFGTEARRRAGSPLPSVGEPIPDGARNTTLTSLAGTMRRRGMSEEAIRAALLAENAARCQPPLPEAEVEAIARSIARYPPALADDDGPGPGLEAVPSWPGPLAEAAFQGLAGEIVRAIAPVTEADPVAVLAHLLVAFGNAVGPGPHIRVQHDHHPARLFAVLVGETAKGRKGSSWSEPRAIMEVAAADWVRRVRNGGFSSGEGLIYQVRDAVYKLVEGEEKLVDPGEPDKRLLVLEPEFAAALAVMRREGNILSPIIRQAWDNGDLAPMVKNTPIRATGTHISIVGHITRDELRARLDDTALASGFANRFIWLAVRRANILPYGGGLPDSEIARLGRRLGEAIAAAQQIGEVRRDPEAADLWAHVYGPLSEGKPGLLGAAIARAEAQVLRLSLVYALLDRSPSIRADHLRAALAVWDYAEASARWIFGKALGDPVADRILEALRAAGQEGLDSTAIRDLFQRNVSAARIGRALDVLLARGLIRVTPQKTGGRPRTVYIYHAYTNDKNDINDQRLGSESFCRLGRLCRNPAG